MSEGKAASPDVVVRVAADVVQIQIEHASVGGVVPVAATDGNQPKAEALCLAQSPICN